MSSMNEAPVAGTAPTPRRGGRWRALSGLLAAALLSSAWLGPAVQGCTESSDHFWLAPTSGAAPVATTLQPWQDQPGLVVDIVSVSTGTAAGGNLQAGDALSVTFTVSQKGGTPLSLSELDSGRIMLAGPTFNYQRVVPQLSDLLTRSVPNQDGSLTYAFADPIPATYAAPLNDTTTFGAGDGELTGQALLSGTYTVAIEVTKSYSVEQEVWRDVGVDTQDLAFGQATTIEPREVVADSACGRCHSELRVHGGNRTSVKTCVLCHTSGAEDKNVASVEGGTPGVSVDLRVMIHKLHNGSHLPSVLGVGTATDGSRSYVETPRPYRLVGFGNAVHDFSAANFPMWPNLNQPMPRDQGYTALPAAFRSLEDAMRRGVTACVRCHGDPDDAGPLAAPAQGDLIYSQPTRRACGSCHDDIDWTRPYTANGQTMPPQADDSQCITCHTPSGTPLSVRDAHLHPLLDPAVNPGLRGALTDVREAGANDGDGVFDRGEKVAITFGFTTDAGVAVVPSASAVVVLIAGPNGNRNLMLNSSIAASNLTGAGPWTFNVPEAIALERVALVADDAAVETFTTIRSPHWSNMGAATTVFTRAAAPPVGGGSSTLTAGAAALDNAIFVASTTGFAQNDRVVFEDGTAREEYAQVAMIDSGNKVWLTTPLRNGHASGSAVMEVTLSTRALNTHYTLNAATGAITEVNPDSFTAGQTVIASYTTDYVIPDVYPAPSNDSTDLDVSWGEWKGLPLIPGSYALGLYGRMNVLVTGYGETTSYPVVNEAASRDLSFLAATAAPTPVIDYSGDTCRSCHGTPLFHGGGRQSYRTCAFCHTAAGMEDLARWRNNGQSTQTTGVTIDFRTMLHKIHMGEELGGGRPTADTVQASPARTLLFTNNTGGVPDTITASAGSFVDDGYRPGMYLTVRGTASNDTPSGRPFTIASVTASVLTLIGYDNLVAEGPTSTSAATLDATTYGVVGNGPTTHFYDAVVFPRMPGGVKQCVACHGSDSWVEPQARDYPGFTTVPTRAWRAVCGSCHETPAAQAHIDAQTSLGVESCVVCHGQGAILDVRNVHRPR